MVLALLLLLYFLRFPVSAVLWHYEAVSEETEQLDHPSVGGVLVDLSANPTEFREGRSVLFPFLRWSTRTGPHILILRLVDPAHAARRARIHRGTLNLPDGSTVALTFVRDKKAPTDEWIAFFDNASQFIVHTHAVGRYELPEAFTVEIEVSVDDGRSIERESLAIRMTRKEVVHRGLGFPLE